jgi:hypothetical protein
MKNIHFITYGSGGHNYEKAKQRILNEAKDFGMFKTIKGFGYKDLSTEFKNKYRRLLQYRKGAGYWCWKIDIILQTLKLINDDDYIVYADCGCTINKEGKTRFTEYLELLENSEYGVIDFEMMEPFNMVIKQCTSQIFNYFNLDTSKIKRGGCIPGVLIIKKGRHIEKILKEFLNLLDYDYKLITDEYNKKEQHKEFWDNRHDQSIFTCLFIKYGSVNIKRNETYSFGELMGDTADGNGTFGSKESLKYPFWATRKR